jgi:predicted nucleotidyltransferase
LSLHPEAFPDHWRSMVCNWAEPKDRVHEIHLFGSRAKGRHEPASDVDLAILLLGEDPGEALAYWMFEADGWGVELSTLLGAKVDLCLAEPETDEIVWPAVRQYGQLIYRRAGYLIAR